VTRVFEHRRVWYLDQARFEAAAALLADALASSFDRVDAVVGIARGGCPLADALALTLAVPVLTVHARHNPTDAMFSKGTGQVEIDAHRFHPPASAAALLIVDDICGTGATLDAVRRYLRTAIPTAKVFTCTLCRNEGSSVLPDAWVWDVRDWVVFPWEGPSQPAGGTLLPIPEVVRFGR